MIKEDTRSSDYSSYETAKGSTEQHLLMVEYNLTLLYYIGLCSIPKQDTTQPRVRLDPAT